MNIELSLISKSIIDFNQTIYGLAVTNNVGFMTSNFLYVAIAIDLTFSLKIYDVTNASNPILKSDTEILGSADCFELFDNHLYIVSDIGFMVPSVLYIYDVSNPELPTLKSTTTLSGYNTRKLVVQENFLFVSDSGTKLLTTYNISNKLNPFKASELYVSSIWHFTIYDNHVFAITNNATFEIINIENRSNPYLVSSTDISEYSDDENGINILIKDNIAYINVRLFDTILLYNVTNKSAPDFISAIETINNPNPIFISDNYLYVLYITESLIEVFDLTNPSNPKFKTSFSTIYQPWGIISSNYFLYIASYADVIISNIEIMEITAPPKMVPVLLNNFHSPVKLLGAY